MTTANRELSTSASVNWKHFYSGVNQPRHIVTLCLILRLRNTLTYLLTSHGPQSDDSSEAEASTPVKGGWGRGSRGHGRGGGLERDRAKLSDETVSSRAARVSADQCRGKGWGKRSQRRSHIIDETVLEDRSVTLLLNWHFKLGKDSLIALRCKLYISF